MGDRTDVDQATIIPADSLLLQRWQSASANWLAAVPSTDTGIRLLLEAFGLYLDRCDGSARLIAIGNGTRVAGIEAFRAAVGESAVAAHVELFAQADDASMKAALLSADALLLFDNDGPLVSMAVALGTPIVGTGVVDGIAAAGLLWSEADASVLAASVERLRGDAFLRSRLRERGFARLPNLFTCTGLQARAGADA